jgi:RNA-binding motif X-linked protein 2
MNRIIRVDHTRYKKRDDEVDDGQDHKASSNAARPFEDGRRGGDLGEDADAESERPMLRVEHELAILIREHDDDDPMKEFLIQEKKEEISAALAKLGDGKAPRSDRRSKTRHHRHHRSHRLGSSGEREDGKRYSHRRRDND